MYLKKGKWTADPEQQYFQVFISYQNLLSNKIFQHESLRSYCFLFQFSAGLRNNYIIQNLAAGVEYEMQVLSVSTNGTSLPSIKLTQRTHRREWYEVVKAWISNYIPHTTVSYNYLSIKS